MRTDNAIYIVLSLVCVLGGCSRVDMHAEAQSPAPMSVTYISSWGVKGSGPGQLDEPTCIATDTIGDAYIVDAGSHFIEKFDAIGTPLLAFEEDMLKHPQGITVDSGGAIYVTDSSRGSAVIFFPSGDKLRELRLQKRPNIEDQLSVAVQDDGMIHILDAGEGKVFTYSPRFRLLRSWLPAASAPDARGRAASMADGPDGFLYVADPDANRILRFTDAGQFASQLNTSSAGSSRSMSDQFAVTRGYIFIMDANGRMLHVWSADGQHKLDVDLAPELGQGSRVPPALAVSPRKELLVLDAPGSRVLRYRLNF
jgi:DNA-binding beta-propeller fold protein YncE